MGLNLVPVGVSGSKYSSAYGTHTCTHRTGVCVCMYVCVVPKYSTCLLVLSASTCYTLPAKWSCRLTIITIARPVDKEPGELVAARLVMLVNLKCKRTAPGVDDTVTRLR